MPDCLRWPRLWYATPTFVLFIALQAPDWRFTGRVWVALVAWAIAGAALDVWMSRHQQQPGCETNKQSIRRLINWSGILGFVVGFPAGLYAHAFRPTANHAGAFATVFNKALHWLSLLLPALDTFHRALLERGRFAYAAYFGSYFVLTVILWLAGFFLFYRAVANMPPVAFAKVMEANTAFKEPPYGANKRQLAWLRLIGMAVILVAIMFLFGRVLPMDAADPAQSGTSFGRAYVTLGFVGPAINMLVYIIQNYRRFLSTLQPDGFLPARDRNHA